MNRSKAEKVEEHYTPSLEVVKVMIKDYFEQHHGEAIDYADLVNTFNLSLPLIIKACEQLEREGKIAGVD
jgi:hypothetical protein